MATIPPAERILLAGLGNIFFGDDAFGVEVARRLVRLDWPEGVRAADFGIRSYDLAYALMDGYDAVVLVDATQRGRPPGTLTLLEIDPDEVVAPDGAVVNGHALDPARVLGLVRSLGGEPAGRLYVLGCEPAVLEPEGGRIGLSAPVRAAVPEAVRMIEALVERLLHDTPAPQRTEVTP